MLERRARLAIPMGWLILAALALPANAPAEVRSWIDRDGVTHYTVDREEAPARLRMRIHPRTRPGLPGTGGTAIPLERVATPEPATAAIDERSDDLAARIQRDREALKQMISREERGGAGLAGDPRLREISERLPRLQSEYREQQREAAD